MKGGNVLLNGQSILKTLCTYPMQIVYLEALAEKILFKNPFEIKRRLADRLFSKIIRRRDNFTCQRCKHPHSPTSKGLHASHYFARKREATRFYYDNLDALCLACHKLWGFGEGRAEYQKFKKAQLGEIRYEELARLAKIPSKEVPFNDRQKIKDFRIILLNAL